MTKADIIEETKAMIIQEEKKDGVDLQFCSFNLVHESGNKYSGLAECTVDGVPVKLSIDIIYDGENIQARWIPIE